MVIVIVHAAYGIILYCLMGDDDNAECEMCC